MVYWLTGATLDKFRTNGTTVGNSTQIAPDAFLDMNFKVTMGEHCVMAARSMVLGHDGAPNMLGLKIPTTIRETIIGDHVFLGVNALVLCGVKIGDNVIIGAGSVVTKDVPSGQVWAGNPARFIETIDEYKTKLLKHKEEFGN